MRKKWRLEFFVGHHSLIEKDLAYYSGTSWVKDWSITSGTPRAKIKLFRSTLIPLFITSYSRSSLDERNDGKQYRLAHEQRL
uniref:Uncharacterized protein n=1 Tax=Romanomermis culicivorax TaxID=13658 RepID=A0A915KC96_ROMCU